jgi:hypothetical protein
MLSAISSLHHLIWASLALGWLFVLMVLVIRHAAFYSGNSAGVMLLTFKRFERYYANHPGVVILAKVTRHTFLILLICFAGLTISRGFISPPVVSWRINFVFGLTAIELALLACLAFIPYRRSLQKVSYLTTLGFVVFFIPIFAHLTPLTGILTRPN